MLLIVAVLIALATALVRPGRLASLAQVRIQGSWAIGLIILFQIWAVLVAPDSAGHLVAGAVVFTQLILAAILWLNRSQPGLRIVALGALLNVVVMAANGGYMPVSAQALSRAGHEYLVLEAEGQSFVGSSKNIVLEPAETRLYPLSDIFTVPRGFPVSGNFSIGDALIAIGVGWFLHRAGDEESLYSLRRV
ncbi:MAG: DUF5317 domain-containing protein [Chloroflexi bacterium]|nr:DUF5317 domain-containing protein [Chloroflexota bacterium]